MWIIKGENLPEEGFVDNNNNDNGIAGLLITIEQGFDIECSKNVLLIYKGYSEFGFTWNGSVPLVAAICNEKEDRTRKTGYNPTLITVEGKYVTVVLKYARMGSTKFSFNASFKVLNSNELEQLSQSGEQENNNNQYPFNVTSLYDGTSPSSVLSRFGQVCLI
jgi:hypothetical protein